MRNLSTEFKEQQNSGNRNYLKYADFTVKLNSGSAEAATVASDGSWSKVITLTEGTNTITVVATDSAGKSTTVTRTVKLDTKAPVIKSVTLTPNPVDTEKTVVISVEVTD